LNALWIGKASAFKWIPICSMSAVLILTANRSFHTLAKLLAPMITFLAVFFFWALRHTLALIVVPYLIFVTFLLLAIVNTLTFLGVPVVIWDEA